MSLIPAFEIGVWNAWIFVFPYVLVTFGLPYLAVSKESMLFHLPPHSKKEKKLFGFLLVTYGALCLYGIFLPLKLSTALFYVGFIVYLLGMIFIIMTMLNFATASSDKPLTKGVFRISRNPMYVGFSLTFIGIGLSCASWIVLLLAVITIILNNVLIIPEERLLLEKYGDSYREYMNRTPRWIGIPK